MGLVARRLVAGGVLLMFLEYQAGTERQAGHHATAAVVTAAICFIAIGAFLWWRVGASRSLPRRERLWSLAPLVIGPLLMCVLEAWVYSS
ncbi:MAG: hypothetical protein ACRENL_11355 [Candidatus Dormibacteria bacterium]